MIDARLLTLARELEAADEALAVALAEVVELDGEVAALCARAAELHGFLAQLPDERERLGAARLEAEAEFGRRRQELDEAERQLAAAEAKGKLERVVAARRAAVHARDALASADRRLERVRESESEVERRAREADTETPELIQRSRGLAARTRDLPRVSPHAGDLHDGGLDRVVEWASGARAALFVVRGSLETERDLVVREANELGASALGEAVAASSVALIRRRLESVR